MELPQFSEDNVTDFLVKEALVQQGAHERRKAEKEQERQEWMKDHKSWAKQAGLAGGGR